MSGVGVSTTMATVCSPASSWTGGWIIWIVGIQRRISSGWPAKSREVCTNMGSVSSIRLVMFRVIGEILTFT
jgi:hypothetical protein